MKDVNFNSRGFTLVELMIALAFIAVGLLGAILANTAIQQRSEGAYQRMVATQDAHRVIEQMRNTSSTGNFPQNVTATFPNGGAVAGFNNLTNEQVTVAYTNPAADPLDITVTTTWRENGMRNATTQLRTLMTQRQ